MSNTGTTGTCELCRRDGVALTRHHLIPRKYHANKKLKKRFTREEMHSNVLLLCRPCHSHIHAILTEKEMAEQFHTFRSLLEHPEVQDFIEWLRTKSPGFKPKFRRLRR